MEYTSDTWLGYNHRFRQTLAALPGTMWACIEPTRWNIAFIGQAKSHQCKHCFSLTHNSADCDWTLTPSPHNQQTLHLQPAHDSTHGHVQTRYAIPGTTARSQTAHYQATNTNISALGLLPCCFLELVIGVKTCRIDTLDKSTGMWVHTS